MKKRTHGITLAILVAGLMTAGVVWLLSSGAPSYEQICQMNDELKQARQLGLSTKKKCAERLGNAILKTSDESLLANLLANVSFDERFAQAILGKIKTPEMIEAVARTFKAELFVGGSDVRVSPQLYDAVLDRLPDDSAVERVVGFRLGEFGNDPEARTNVRGEATSGKSDLAASLLRRILAMKDKERAESLMEKMADLGIFRTISSDTRLKIALRTKNGKLRQAMDVDQEVLELGDLVMKWDPDCLSCSVREILDRGHEIRDAQKYVEIIGRFDPDFMSSDIEQWIEYGESVQPLLAAIERLSANAGVNPSDSDRQRRFVKKRDEAQKTLDELKNMIDEVRTAIDKNDFATIMAACKYTGVYFNASDPDGTGYRLGIAIRERYQEAQNEIQAANRELSALDRFTSSQREKTKGEISKLKSQLEQIRQHHEMPEILKKREARGKVERDRLAANVKTIPVSDQVSIGLQSVSSDLWFGKTEVTQAQWATVMGDNPSMFKNPENPVESVSWDDCQEFLKKLNALPSVKKSGLTFRLPTAGEWEYACRAGARGDYCKLANGTEEETLGEVAWFDENSDDTTHPVGQKQPNAFGLYDMHGNVWEWTSTADGVGRVFRGGSWDSSAWDCRSSHRIRFSPSYRYYDLGFRLCASSRAD